jgi:hypothetical protein
VKTRTGGNAGEHLHHTFRATGITVFLQEWRRARRSTGYENHTDPRTTNLYERRRNLSRLSAIERRIAFE